MPVRLEKTRNSLAEIESGVDSPGVSRQSRDVGSVLSIDRIRSATDRTASLRYTLLKRLLDLGICFLLLPVIAPIFLALAVAVRLGSPGPVFYREQRVGRLGRPFWIFKFRSMYTAEYLRDVLRYSECEQTMLRRRSHGKTLRDPRVTWVGNYLRKLSLDELPQIINILRGEMSLVGPRPVVSAELEHYGVDAFFYRLMVPGLTGLWQVSGRSDLSYEHRVNLDVQYCATWSASGDLKIMARTIPAVLLRKGAY